MRPLRTLVVDDDFAVADLHERYVRAHRGCAVVGKVHTGQAALGFLNRQVVDLVLLDLYLPDVHGLQLLRDLREDAPRPTTEVIVVTAARDLESVRAARHSGVFHYIAKPFTVQDLHGRLDQVVEAAHTMRGPVRGRPADGPARARCGAGCRPSRGYIRAVAQGPVRSDADAGRLVAGQSARRRIGE
ncbi:MAG: response regulator [Ornithinimicrobium sp.]|jgi:two-component system CitB family response regulator|uniref:response regulator n=1 Tax=Ornithinimicrobium sp. TaxID=1977084 RepID=UPI003D9AD3ED